MTCKYKIHISYRTGNSFGSYDEERYLEPTWEKLEIAKEALKRIGEHYRWYDDKHERWDSKGLSEPEWHKGIEYDFCLKIPLDNGNEVMMSAFWCGYFEKLHSAKIVIIEDDEMEISF